MSFNPSDRLAHALLKRTDSKHATETLDAGPRLDRNASVEKGKTAWRNGCERHLCPLGARVQRRTRERHRRATADHPEGQLRDGRPKHRGRRTEDRTERRAQRQADETGTGTQITQTQRREGGREASCCGGGKQGGKLLLPLREAGSHRPQCLDRRAWTAVLGPQCLDRRLRPSHHHIRHKIDTQQSGHRRAPNSTDKTEQKTEHTNRQQ